MYTPFRRKPRIFPAVVSAIVTVSEAITRPPPHSPGADFVLEGASVISEAALAGKMARPAKPAPKVATPLMKERRALNGDADSRFSGLFDIVSALYLRLSNGEMFGSPLWRESVLLMVSSSRNATLMCLAS
jgi:hypothetical protein